MTVDLGVVVWLTDGIRRAELARSNRAPKLWGGFPIEMLIVCMKLPHPY